RLAGLRRGGPLVGRASVVVAARAEPERPDERLDPGPDGRIADPELALDVAEVAARPEEALQEGGLIPAQPGEAADRELTLERRPARPAAEPRDRELTGADGTGGDDVVCHAFLVSVAAGRIVTLA